MVYQMLVMLTHDLNHSSNKAQNACVLTAEASFIIYYLQSVRSDATSFGTCSSFEYYERSKETEAQGPLPVLGSRNMEGGGSSHVRAEWSPPLQPP